jgi:RpiB/LacA/LacB family sugar-phosphate isomerase
MRLLIGSDHAGFRLKSALVTWLRSRAGGRHSVRDVGCSSADSCDYPDFAFPVARGVARGQASRGILLCGTGIGMAIAANKVRGVRAAVCWSPRTAVLAAEHNRANIICLPGRLLRFPRAKVILRAYLRTPYGGGRHARRVRKITRLDRCS